MAAWLPFGPLNPPETGASPAPKPLLAPEIRPQSLDSIHKSGRYPQPKRKGRPVKGGLISLYI